jgi:hypothetical protein
MIAPIADTFGPKLTRPPRGAAAIDKSSRSSSQSASRGCRYLGAPLAALAAIASPFRSLAPGTRSSWIPPVPTTAGRQPLPRTPHALAARSVMPPAGLSTPLHVASRTSLHQSVRPDCGLRRSNSLSAGLQRAASRPDRESRPDYPMSVGRCPEAVLHLKSAAMDGRFEMAPKSQSSTQGAEGFEAGDPGRIAQGKGAPTDAGRPLNSGVRRARIRRASVGVCKSSSTFHASTRPSGRFPPC